MNLIISFLVICFWSRPIFILFHKFRWLEKIFVAFLFVIFWTHHWKFIILFCAHKALSCSVPCRSRRAGGCGAIPWVLAGASWTSRGTGQKYRKYSKYKTEIQKYSLKYSVHHGRLGRAGLGEVSLRLNVNEHSLCLYLPCWPVHFEPIYLIYFRWI